MESPAALPERRKALGELRAVEQAREDTRAGIVLLAIYLVDAALLAGFCATGLFGWIVPALFAATGITVAGGFALAVARTGHARLNETNAILAQTAIALLLTLGVGWAYAPAAFLMLLTVFIIIPTAALRLSHRRTAVVLLATALGCVAIVDRHGGHLSLPMATGWQRLLTGLFFLWTLIKAASVSVVGIAMRLALDQSHAKLAEALAEVEKLAESDELTGLPNRRRILAVLTEVHERQTRSGGGGYSIAMLDIDHFKRINDTFGHGLGDQVLRVIASLARGAVRSDAAVGRIGGEEFLLVLPGARAIGEAMTVAERLRATVEQHDWATLEPSLRVTASLGLAVGEAGETTELLIERADRGLYQAKRSGRNRVACAPDGTPRPVP
jgi:diguanylate cyclase